MKNGFRRLNRIKFFLNKALTECSSCSVKDDTEFIMMCCLEKVIDGLIDSIDLAMSNEERIKLIERKELL